LSRLRAKGPLSNGLNGRVNRKLGKILKGLPWERADGFAIICGAKTKDGFYVGAIDFDVKNLPEEVIAKGREALKHMPITQIEQTPSGGSITFIILLKNRKALAPIIMFAGLRL
jgi:hypothetical protein